MTSEDAYAEIQPKSCRDVRNDLLLCGSVLWEIIGDKIAKDFTRTLI